MIRAGADLLLLSKEDKTKLLEIAISNNNLSLVKKYLICGGHPDAAIKILAANHIQKNIDLYNFCLSAYTIQNKIMEIKSSDEFSLTNLINFSLFSEKPIYVLSIQQTISALNELYTALITYSDKNNSFNLIGEQHLDVLNHAETNFMYPKICTNLAIKTRISSNSKEYISSKNFVSKKLG